MINLKEEIITCLQDWRNTNNKEQNLQGWLYAYFLKYRSEGYVIEMETNIRQDEHLGWLFKNKDVDRNNFCKSEVDLFIYNESQKEAYAVELKWIYHRDTGWNVVDHLPAYECDAQFCNQLLSHYICSDVCSLVVYDFNPEKQVKNPRFSKDSCKKEDFLGGKYTDEKGNRRQPTAGRICGIPFKWLPLYDDYCYYIIDGKDMSRLQQKL